MKEVDTEEQEERKRIYSMYTIYKGRWTPLQMSGFGYFSHLLTGVLNQAHAISTDKH